VTSPSSVEVLILANLHDFPTDRVCVELDKLGVRYVRLNRETLSEAALRLDPVAPRLQIALEGRRWSVDETLKAVWWRQPTFLRNTPHQPLSLDEQLDRSQWPAFLRGLMLFDEALWINDPAATYRAECKPWQLRQAARLGFETPPTLITNDPEAPVPAQLGKTVAVKSVDTVLLREGDRQFFAYTQLLDWSICATPALRAAPVLAQAVIAPKLDLRVTVLGDRVWAVAVEADGVGVEGDWRLRKKDQLAYPAFMLPAEVAERCVALVAQMGLVYGAIDLALREGRFVFIEINPTGEWGWLDTPDRPIAAAIAQALARR
jgi:hypothetical protein